MPADLGIVDGPIPFALWNVSAFVFRVWVLLISYVCSFIYPQAFICSVCACSILETDCAVIVQEVYVVTIKFCLSHEDYSGLAFAHI